MLLSPHFSLSEFTNSATADSYHIDNTPSNFVVKNLSVLCVSVLEPVRQIIHKPIVITSGYRSTALNKIVGGVENSYHLSGKAADIHVTSKQEGRTLALLFLDQKLTDLVILEINKQRLWLHVQWSKTPRHKYLEKTL